MGVLVMGIVRPEAPKEKRRNHWLRWLLWWKIEPEELQKNIVEYDTLRIYQSARGTSFLLLLFSVAVTIIGICVGLSNAWTLVDAIVGFGLAVFIYRGHRWAMLLAMVYWTLEKAGQFYLHADNYLLVIVWWTAYMHAFYLSFIVEQKRSIISCNPTNPAEAAQQEKIPH